MLDFKSRRFIVRLGRNNKSGEPVNKRASIVGRKLSARRVSVRNSTALRRAPSGAGGLQRGTSVRRSPSGVRRGASVRRAPSSARRNSQRASLYVDGNPPASSSPAPNAETGPATTLVPEPSSVQPAANPAPSLSFLSKLAIRFRGRSKKTQAQPAPSPSAIAATFSATNLSPIGIAPPRSPSLRSPSPGSRVTFVDTAHPNRVSAIETDNTPAQPGVDTSAVEEAEKLPQKSGFDIPMEIVDEPEGAEDEWVDAEDDIPHPEPHVLNKNNVIGSVHADSVMAQSAVPECASEEVQIPENILSSAPVTNSENPAKDQLEVVRLQADLLSDLGRESIGVDVRVSQWLAITPVVAPDEGSQSLNDGRGSLEDGAKTAVIPKVEAKRRPPHIVVPGSSSTLSSKNPFRVPLPPSPSPSNVPPTLPETNPFRAESSLAAEASSPDGLIPPPSPSIFLTPAAKDESPDVSRNSDELLAVDCAQFPLPPSPSPSHVSLPQTDEVSRCASPPATTATVTRNGSVSTSGGRSLSTAPSTRGPATPTSARIPGHPAFAHFSFGGPRSPSLKIEDWEEGEEERRGRSLEVSGSKRRMRSTSPGLDAVLEGDESRRSSKASIEGFERKAGTETAQPLSPLPVLEEDTTFGRKGSEDTETEPEDADGFFAFAEQQLERERKVAEARQLDAPKRSKTISFLSFGKRKSTLADPMPMPTSRSATPSGLLSPPLPTPKRSSTLAASASDSSNRVSRLLPGQRSSTMMPAAEPRVALSPTMYTVGDIHTETGKIEDEESRRLSEAVFMF
ncbi:hypothetical protein RhiLY_02614 [Ceratobasidium sp. AG-Ba]|nr:hypothetical protein RhiLY_02614 [Ceratobasidium sp. AG-Ba]